MYGRPAVNCFWPARTGPLFFCQVIFRSCRLVTAVCFLMIFFEVGCAQKSESTRGRRPRLADFPIIETGPAVIASPPGIPAFYARYTNAAGVLIVASAKTPDAALLSARTTILFLLSKRPDIHAAMLQHHPRISIMASTETASDLPEFGPDSDGQWGLGQMPGDPTTLVSVKGVCFPGNREYIANFLIHEFVHMVHNLGLPEAEPTTVTEIYSDYVEAVHKGLFMAPKDEPLGSLPAAEAYGDDEYFTTAVNAWYDLNESWPGPWMDVKAGDRSAPSGTRAELEARDPKICAIIRRIFPEDTASILKACRLIDLPSRARTSPRSS